MLERLEKKEKLLLISDTEKLAVKNKILKEEKEKTYTGKVIKPRIRSPEGRSSAGCAAV